MQWYWSVLATLGVWRVAHLCVAEDGPWRVIAKLRNLLAPVSTLFDCFYCVSLWVAIPFAWVVGTNLLEKALLWPALSAAAILLEHITASGSEFAATIEEDEG